MCKETVVAMHEEKDEFLSGVGHHASLFTKAGYPVEDRHGDNGWITAESDFASGPGQYVIETPGQISSSALKRIDDFYKGICSSTEKFMTFIREKGWDDSLIVVLTDDAKNTFWTVRNALQTSYDKLSEPITAEIVGKISGEVTVRLTSKELYEDMVVAPMTEVFCSLFAGGFNRINSWKKL